MNEERVDRIEERLAWLERHVLEQDKAMLALSDELNGLRKELLLLRSRVSAGGGGSDDAFPPDERPPHY